MFFLFLPAEENKNSLPLHVHARYLTITPVKGDAGVFSS